MTTPAHIVAAARAQLGTPWMHQARLPGVALDCAGLVICVARSLGLVPDTFDVGGYTRSPDGTLLDTCAQHMQPLAGPELGAVIVVQIEQEPQHLGIIGDYRHGGWSMIHASSRAQPPRVVETRLMWARNMQLRGIYRLPGVQAEGG
jgi:cell wall-associated NlpC family hydrolase